MRLYRSRTHTRFTDILFLPFLRFCRFYRFTILALAGFAVLALGGRWPVLLAYVFVAISRLPGLSFYHFFVRVYHSTKSTTSLLWPDLPLYRDGYPYWRG